MLEDGGEQEANTCIGNVDALRWGVFLASSCVVIFPRSLNNNTTVVAKYGEENVY